MIRGWYTGASGMIAQQYRLDTIANNLANVDTDGYKRDVAVHKAFAQMLLRRIGDDGLYIHPLGSGDYAPVIGKIGTGVETNELFTQFEQGALKATESDFDLALDCSGLKNPAFFVVSTPDGERLTRNGGFILGKEGYLETKDGYPLMGENGPISVKANNFVVDKDGNVFVNLKYLMDPEQMVGREENEWDQLVLLDRIQTVVVDEPRFLAKQGSSLWKTTEESGPMRIAEGAERPKVIQGFTEASNVEPVLQMVQMIEVNRAYEANQKSIQAEDGLIGKLINEVVRV